MQTYVDPFNFFFYPAGSASAPAESRAIADISGPSFGAWPEYCSRGRFFRGWFGLRVRGAGLCRAFFRLVVWFMLSLEYTSRTDPGVSNCHGRVQRVYKDLGVSPISWNLDIEHY